MEGFAHEETRDASEYARRTVSGCSSAGSMPQRDAARAVMAAASCTVIAPVGVKLPVAHAVDNAVGRRRVDIWCVPRRLHHILERAAVFGGEIQRADDNLRELRARKIRGGLKGRLRHAVENAVGRERFDRLLRRDPLRIGERWGFRQTRDVRRHTGLRGVYVL